MVTYFEEVKLCAVSFHQYLIGPVLQKTFEVGEGQCRNPRGQLGDVGCRITCKHNYRCQV